jgi:acyl-coenzyme A synthetase/AMP-(fatty) acid ligase
MCPGDVYWCTADCGWITGHTYLTYGPLLNGATSVVFEGVPTYPNVGRMWDIVAKHKVKQFYTAPTAIRALMVHGDEPVKEHDRSSLQVWFPFIWIEAMVISAHKQRFFSMSLNIRRTGKAARPVHDQ